MIRSLDLGSGEFPRNDNNSEECYGIDIFDFNNPMIKVADLAIEKIPFDDSYFDHITAYDFIEHIPRLLYIDGKRTQPFIDLMSDIYRVLKPGGRFSAYTPAFPYYETFQDPTHVNFITEYTVQYFAGEAKHLGERYGFNGNFKLNYQGWHPHIRYWLIWELEAVK